MGEWQDYENHLLNEQVTIARRNKLKTMYSIIKRFIEKPLIEVERKDIEEFINNLHRNNYKKKDGKEYGGHTKCDLKKFLKQYFKWLKGDNEFYPKEVSWLKTRISKDDKPSQKPVLSYDEIIKLANSFQKVEYRILSLLLFDSGFRIQEMLSAKKKNLTWEEYTEEGEKCFWVFCNESKTFKRKVPVPLFTEDLKTFSNSSYFNNLKEEEPLFNVNYNCYRGALRNAGDRLFKKRLTPHCLRHSSATFYSQKFDGNMNLIAQRYGWSFSSKELMTYIRQSGAYQKQGAKKIFSNELMKVKEENNKLKEEMNELKNQFDSLKDNILEDISSQLLAKLSGGK